MPPAAAPLPWWTGKVEYGSSASLRGLPLRRARRRQLRGSLASDENDSRRDKRAGAHQDVLGKWFMVSCALWRV